MHRYKGGGWVYPAHANTRNRVNGDIQRFATLVCPVVDGFKRGKTRQRKVHAIHREDENKVLTYRTI